MPKLVDKEQRRREILETAITVFGKKGYRNTKASDLAEAAGIGKGTLYEYFRSKEEIFAGAFHLYFEHYERELQNVLTRESDPERQMHLLIKASFEMFLQGSSEFATVIMDFWAEGARKDSNFVEQLDLKSVYGTFRDEIAAIITTGIEQGRFRQVNTQAVAGILIAAMDGLALQWLMDPSLFDIEQTAQTLFETIINGIRKE